MHDTFMLQLAVLRYRTESCILWACFEIWFSYSLIWFSLSLGAACKLMLAKAFDLVGLIRASSSGVVPSFQAKSRRLQVLIEKRGHNEHGSEAPRLRRLTFTHLV